MSHSGALGSEWLRRVQVPPVLWWRAPYPKVGVMPHWPSRAAGAAEDRVSTARWNLKGLRSSTGL